MKLPSMLTGAALVAAILAATSPAAAHGAVNYETLYYQNGQLVGADIVYCDGHRDFWGDMTQLPAEFNYYGCD
jgi:hypothetical protein